MAAEPAFFQTEADFRQWFEANHRAADQLLVGFWKKNSGKASIDWPQARDQALCFGWIDGVRRSIGEDAYTIRFTPRRKGSIWSKVNVERFEALKAAGLMTSEGERSYEENKHRTGLYAYETEQEELSAAEDVQFRANVAAWADWQKRPAGYRRSALHWITTAKRPETRAKRLTELIKFSGEGRRLPQYDRQKKS